MQQQKHSRQARQALTREPALLVLLGAAALLAMLIVAGWGRVRAAPQSGAPSITILSITGNTLNLQFAGWSPNETVTLSYSSNAGCSAHQPLPNATFSIAADPFDAPYTWPGGIAPGMYYLCASGLEGTFASMQPVIVNSNGAVQSTPGVPGTTPTATTTRSGTPTTTSSSPGPSATAAPGTTGTPVTNGQGAAPPSSNTDASTLVAIILLCLLVLALLAYLIRIWLQGRQASGSPPGGGGQQKP